MKRDAINDNLKNQLEKMLISTNVERVIKVKIKRTQIQKKSLCGYFACAFATALCYKIDIETINFDIEKLTTHWLSCIKTKKATSFPSCLKHKSNNLSCKILTYTRELGNVESEITKGIYVLF